MHRAGVDDFTAVQLVVAFCSGTAGAAQLFCMYDALWQSCQSTAEQSSPVECCIVLQRAGVQLWVHGTSILQKVA
jgi:hypothetical protein